MIYRYSYLNEDWNNIDVLERNRMKTRPFYCGFDSLEKASTCDRYQSENVKLMNGNWNFYYGETPFDIPESFMEYTFDDSEWGKMPVPGHWQLHGYDKPIFK